MKSQYPWFYKYLFAAARRIFGWSPEKRKAFVKVSHGDMMFRCEKCTVAYDKKELHVDHKLPVMPLQGFDNWDAYFNRLFCPVNGLQILCKQCHKIKTKSENALRKELRTKGV